MADEQRDEGPPFEFWRMAFLVEVTSYRASSLAELLTSVTLAPVESIFYHLHQRFFREPDRLPDYPNDFAAWADHVLGDAVVAERLANLNLFRSIDLETVRREVSVILAEHLAEHGDERGASDGAFIFCRARQVMFRSGQQARTPKEFLDVLRTLEVDAIGGHLFMPKALWGDVANDFASCFKRWGYATLAAQLDAFDPYLNSLEDNRCYLIELIENGLREAAGGDAHA